MKKNNYPVCIGLIIVFMLGACRTAPVIPVAAETAAPVSKPDEIIATVPDESIAASEVVEWQRMTRKMNSGELVNAIATMNLQPARPKTLMMKALCYASLHGPGDLQRAQNLLDQLAKSDDGEAQRYRSMAIFLSAMYGDWMRVDETNDRLTQQARDSQKRIDQLTEKLEALKNIERRMQERSGSGAANGIAGTAKSQPEPLSK